MKQSSVWGAKLKHGLAAAARMLSAQAALAQSADPKEWQLNMGKGVTHTSRMAWDAHMVALWVCTVIGVLVFGAMAYAMFKFRHAKGAVAAPNGRIGRGRLGVERRHEAALPAQGPGRCSSLRDRDRGPREPGRRLPRSDAAHALNPRFRDHRKSALMRTDLVAAAGRMQR